MTATSATPPNRLLLMMEGRAIPELFGFAAALPTLTALAPRGEGQPVLVLPGLTTSDRSTVAMRRFLKSKGFSAYGWDLGKNFGPLPGIEDGMIARIKELYEKYGQKVSLVGWSLGGIYARQLAKMMPDHVRQVVTLGSPFRGDPRATNAWRVYQMASGQSVDDGHKHMGGGMHKAPPVPTTAIYSKTDGICAWQNCIEQDTDTTENIEVKASHCGLGHHPAVIYAIADRLSQPEGDWQKFDRTGMKAMIYSKPSYAA